MEFNDTVVIGLATVVQQQQQLLIQATELTKIILEEDDEEDLLETYLPDARSTWAFKRHGNFWEKDVPENSDKFFKESFRVERPKFDLLVQRLQVLRKQNTSFRNAIALEKRIAIALYTLGSSAEYRTVGRLFGVSPSMVCKILQEFCRAVISELSEEYLPPDFLTTSKIDECVKGFEDIGFPQCLGAIDGCHIEIKPLAAEAADHYNYKGWHSVVLFALVDFRFLYVNVGCPGRCNDSQIYRQSELNKMMESSPLLEEKSREICGTEVPVLLIGDSAFQFSRKIMKPYPFSTDASLEQQTFNYNLSKARRVVENAFGHLKMRFRRIGKGLDNHPKFNNKIIMCCCILHNFLNYHNSEINENWKTDVNDILTQPNDTNMSGDFSQPAEHIRKAIAKFVTDR